MHAESPAGDSAGTQKKLFIKIFHRIYADNFLLLPKHNI